MNKRVFFVFLLLVLSGCTSKPHQELAASAPSAPPGSYGPPSSYGAPSPEPSAQRSAPSSAAESRDAYAPSPTGDASYRPGLATSWGEHHRSQVQGTYFERADGGQPNDWTRVQYDDEAGVRAATGSAPYGWTPHVQWLLGGALVVSVVDDDTDALPSVRVGSASYVVAERGERYLIRVENRSQTRFEIVASVDGLDVLDGRPGNFQKRGYIVNPGSELLIEGFRLSDGEVAAFRFGSVGESYAAARGDASNVGVIGIAAFAERGPTYSPAPEEIYRRQNANPFPSRYATPPGY